MVILLWWREVSISILLISCLWLINKNQSLDFKVKEITIAHQGEILKAEKKTSDLIAAVESQRKKDAENYAKELNTINDKYNSALLNSNRMHEKVTTYNTRLHTVTRETLENYAKTGSILYGQCKSEYLNLGYYTSKLDAELDKVTKSPD